MKISLNAEQKVKFARAGTLVGIAIAFGWFAFQSAFFAVKVKTGIPPDENHHFVVAHLYHEAEGFQIKEGERTYPYGTVNHLPYLYHLILGELIPLNVFGLSDWQFLRLLNWLLGFAFIYFFIKLVREVTDSNFVLLAALAVLTNIPMLALLYGSVSYDTMINLLALVSAVYLVRFFKNHQTKDLLSHGAVVLAGCVTKLTFLPFVLITALTLALKWRNAQPGLTAALQFRDYKTKEWLLLALCAFFLVLNIRLYGRNLTRFHAIFPSADQVWGHEVADYYYSQYHRDVEFAKAAEHKGLIPLSEYLSLYRISAVSTMFGVMAHRSISRTMKYIDRYSWAILPLFLGMAFYWVRPRPWLPPLQVSSRYLSCVALPMLFYMLVVFLDNYRSYTIHKVYGAGLQGRYYFPVIGHFALTYGYFSMSRGPTWFRVGFLLTLLGILISWGFTVVRKAVLAGALS